MRRSVCVTVAVPTTAAARGTRESCGDRADLFELRADCMAPGEIAGGDWLGLPVDGSRWVFTWRSPREGGTGGERPPGLLRQALESGFVAVDTEAQSLARDKEAAGIPAEHRWVSTHFNNQPSSAADWESRWGGVAKHGGALHKMVVTSEDGGVTGAVLDHIGRLRATGASAFSVFAQGVAGHASRILGGLRGNAVTFAAPPGRPGAAPGQPDLGALVDDYRFYDQPADAPVYGVLGFPALHSLSPRMHNAVLARKSLEGIYLPMESENPRPVIEDVRSGAIVGLSVTAPHKVAAARSAELRSPEVEQTGAANTLWLEDNRLHAANTDVNAARTLLGELGVEIGSQVAILGAGGAAAGVAAAAQGLTGEVDVFSRDQAAGEALASRCHGAWGGDLDRLVPSDYRAVVNATPLGRQESLPAQLQDQDWSDTGILDLAYGSGPTGFENLARDHHLEFRGGRRFLALQGREQFRLWTGCSPDLSWFEEALS